ncbi:DUF1643 domain-containing protein [Paenibacillus sp. UNC451MF]|uniref:DUF1643 domain-containing protein n=1 Tax=Paenibacillus sp. UNC451MF TaxID=1449063 RepID=UPI00068C01F6|nr:DUF1643 domain-containing protein [Paenibacillus sp. UNC451MF]
MKEYFGTVTSKAIYEDSQRKYRYYLERTWEGQKEKVNKTATIVMLNPSYADEFKTDTSIMRVTNLLVDMGYNCLRIVNLFAYVATVHTALSSTIGNTGDKNNEWITKAIMNVDLLIIAWGSDEKKHVRRKREVTQIINNLSRTEKPKKIKWFVDEDGRKGRHPSRLKELKLVDYS